MRFPILICLLAVVLTTGCSNFATSPPRQILVPPSPEASNAEWDAYVAKRDA